MGEVRRGKRMGKELCNLCNSMSITWNSQNHNFKTKKKSVWRVVKDNFAEISSNERAEAPGILTQCQMGGASQSHPPCLASGIRAQTQRFHRCSLKQNWKKWEGKESKLKRGM